MYLVLFQVRQGNWAEATEMLGEANPFRDSGQFRALLHISKEYVAHERIFR
jgi:hypothetical protein